MGFLDETFAPDPASDDAERSTDEIVTPGWDAITAACEALYPDQLDPLHLATRVTYALGGPDPLDGVSIYRVAEPRPHWHYVSYGLSDLYGSGEPGGDVSGFGFEFTFRLAAEDALSAEHCPVWPVNLMQNLAGYVFRTGNLFGPGHHLDANGPIEADNSATRLTAVGFVTDPRLGTIATPHGRVVFLQLLGLTADDLTAAMSWNAESLYALLVEKYPLGVTEMSRDSLRTDPALAVRVSAGISSDGSSMAALFTNGIAFAEDADGAVVVELGLIEAVRIRDMVRGRLPFGRGLIVDAGDHGMVLTPASTVSVALAGDSLDIGLTPDVAAALCEVLRDVPGTYVVPGIDGVRWVVAEAAPDE